MSLETELLIRTPMHPTKKVVVQTMYTGDFVLNKINAVLKPHNLSSQQYNVLRILKGQKGKCINMTDIQQRMINKNSNTTRLMDKLVDKGLVSREVDEDNRRKLNICITKKGLKFLQKIDPLVDGVEAKTTEQLTDKEIETLNSLLEKVRY